MYLLILESIGTQELILIGIIALVVFGPRKLPEMARKLGSMMTEFRRVSNDFRSTWENAVALDEAKSSEKISENVEYRDTFESEQENETGIASEEPEKTNGKAALPEVREMSIEEYDNLMSDRKNKKTLEQQEKTEWI